MASDRVELRLPGTARGVIRVTKETADYWRGLGYVDAQEKKAAPARKPPAKKSDDE